MLAVDLRRDRHRQPGRPRTATEPVTAHTFPSASRGSNGAGAPVVRSIKVDNPPYTSAVSSGGVAAQRFTRASGSSLCFADGFLTAKWAPVNDSGQDGGPGCTWTWPYPRQHPPAEGSGPGR
ncbi:hypothetical protein ACFW3D_19055 [Streptomyces sp. NPDC058864]